MLIGLVRVVDYRGVGGSFAAKSIASGEGPHPVAPRPKHVTIIASEARESSPKFLHMTATLVTELIQ